MCVYMYMHPCIHTRYSALSQHVFFFGVVLGANLETVGCASLLGANCGRRRELQWPRRAWIQWKSSRVYLRRCRRVLKTGRKTGVKGADLREVHLLCLMAILYLERGMYRARLS